MVGGEEHRPLYRRAFGMETFDPAEIEAKRQADEKAEASDIAGHRCAFPVEIQSRQWIVLFLRQDHVGNFEDQRFRFPGRQHPGP